ncbi:hypothetical protein [Rhodococcus oryzae]|jgi:hypothetical protein|uniref:hypothetical protein n=1 Tax=Rhodococcus oryzae TaxID=2571143 RepID=UPI0037A4B992
MSSAMVVTIEFGDESVSAALVETGTRREHKLTLGQDKESTLRKSPQTIVPVAAAAAAIAHAHLAGVVTGPDALVLTHPSEWKSRQIGDLLDAATAAGFGPDQVTVRVNPKAEPGVEGFLEVV